MRYFWVFFSLLRRTGSGGFVYFIRPVERERGGGNFDTLPFAASSKNIHGTTTAGAPDASDERSSPLPHQHSARTTRARLFSGGSSKTAGAAEKESTLLAAAFTVAAPPLSIRYYESDCLPIMTPAEISCWCRDCKVHRCQDCSERYRSSPCGLLHVTDKYEPALRRSVVLQVRAGENGCALAGFEFCQDCASAELTTSNSSAVTMISERFGVASVNVPGGQVCSNSKCGRVHERWEILFRLYGFYAVAAAAAAAAALAAVGAEENQEGAVGRLARSSSSSSSSSSQ